jgi:hypothetical protein
MTTTMLVCSKCGLTAEYHAALQAGWLCAELQDAPPGHLIIRCPEHITGHAMRLAGLPQQRTSSRIEDNIGRGLWAEYGDGYVASAYESEDEDGKLWYVLSYHKGQMPSFDAQAFETIQALTLAMRKIQPDVRRWRLAEGL